MRSIQQTQLRAIIGSNIVGDDDSRTLPVRCLSGGTVLYAGLGVRTYTGRFSAALAARTSFARWLNERADQQGSEGLEWVRVALTLSYVLPL